MGLKQSFSISPFLFILLSVYLSVFLFVFHIVSTMFKFSVWLPLYYTSKDCCSVREKTSRVSIHQLNKLTQFYRLHGILFCNNLAEFLGRHNCLYKTILQLMNFGDAKHFIILFKGKWYSSRIRDAFTFPFNESSRLIR